MSPHGPRLRCHVRQFGPSRCVRRSGGDRGAGPARVHRAHPVVGRRHPNRLAGLRRNPAVEPTTPAPETVITLIDPDELQDLPDVASALVVRDERAALTDLASRITIAAIGVRGGGLLLCCTAVLSPTPGQERSPPLSRPRARGRRPSRVPSPASGVMSPTRPSQSSSTASYARTRSRCPSSKRAIRQAPRPKPRWARSGSRWLNIPHCACARCPCPTANPITKGLP